MKSAVILDVAAGTVRNFAHVPADFSGKLYPDADYLFITDGVGHARIAVGPAPAPLTIPVPPRADNHDELLELIESNYALAAGKLGGSGTLNRLAKFTGALTLGDGSVSDDGLALTPITDNTLSLGITTKLFKEGRFGTLAYAPKFGLTVLNIEGLGIPNATWIGQTGTPETNYAAPVSSLFSRFDGAAGTSLYLKESGTGNTGWASIITSSVLTGLANPSAIIGLTAVNGSALTALRSDGAPALSQAIVPLWTGLHTFYQQEANAIRVGTVTPANVLASATSTFPQHDRSVGPGVTMTSLNIVVPENQDINFKQSPAGGGMVTFTGTQGLGFVPNINGPDYGTDIGGIQYRTPVESMALNFFLFRGGQYLFESQTAGWMVQFTPTGVNIGSTADNVLIPVSKFEVDGNATIGSAYARVSAAPANGLLVQGRVGLGIVSPGYPLEIASGDNPSLAYQRTGFACKKWAFASDNSNTYWQNLTDGLLTLTVSNAGNVTTLGNLIVQGTGASSIAGTLQVTGFVGLGITPATYPLEIASNSNPSFAYQRTGVSAKKWGFATDNSNTYWQNLTDGFLNLTLSNAGNLTALGYIDCTTGYRIANAAASGNFLRGNGTNFVSSAIQAGDLSGALFANPTATIGLTAVNGSALTALRSDSAPPLSQAIAPLWTGVHRWTNNVVTGQFVDPAATDGFLYLPTTDSTPTGVPTSYAGAAPLVLDEDSDSLYFYNGGWKLVNAVGASPTASVGLTAVNGTSALFMRRDGAPALSVAIAPTWTGVHTFSNGTYSALFMGGNVGIGKATPGEKLELYGNLKLSNATIPTGVRALAATGWAYSPDAYRVIQLGASSGNETVAIGYDPATNASVAFSGDGREVVFRRGVQFVTPNAANTAINTLNLVMLDGNVGIGKSPTSGMLDVNGVICAQTGYQINAFAASGNFLRGNGTNFVSSAIQAGDLPGALFANPTATIGLTAVNGSATTAIRSDGAPALSQGIAPTWTGLHTFSRAFNVDGIKITGGSPAGTEFRVLEGGANTGGIGYISYALGVNFSLPASNIPTVIGTTGGYTQGSAISFGIEDVYGDGLKIWTGVGTGAAMSQRLQITSGGAVSIGPAAPAAGTLLDVNGVINALTGYRIGNAAASGNFLRGNGTNFVSSAIQAGDLPGALFANPTATIGLTAVNGSATTALRSDGAPALSQSISPTWTGSHVFDLGGGGGANLRFVNSFNGIIQAPRIANTNTNQAVGASLDYGLVDVSTEYEAASLFTRKHTTWDGTAPNRSASFEVNVMLANNRTRHLFCALGSVVVGENGAIATNATDGFLYVPTVAGTPTGTPAFGNGKSALVYDTTNNKLYIFNLTSSAWKSVTLA